jgi:hypothetical protein
MKLLVNSAILRPRRWHVVWPRHLLMDTGVVAA